MSTRRPRQIPYQEALHTPRDNPLSIVDVIKILTTQFLVTPDKIVFDQAQWFNWIPEPLINSSILINNYANSTTGMNPGLGVGYLGGNKFQFDPDSILLGDGDFGQLLLDNSNFSRIQRLNLEPLDIRYRDINQLETLILNARLGDINARWLLSATPNGTEYWKNPDLVCRDPNGLWRTQTNQLFASGVTPTDQQLRAVFDVGLGVRYQKQNELLFGTNPEEFGTAPVVGINLTAPQTKTQEINKIISETNASTAIYNQRNPNNQVPIPLNLNSNTVEVVNTTPAPFFQKESVGGEPTLNSGEQTVLEASLNNQVPININGSYSIPMTTNQIINTSVNASEKNIAYAPSLIRTTEELIKNPPPDYLTPLDKANVITTEPFVGTAYKPLGVNNVTPQSLYTPPPKPVGLVTGTGIPLIASNPINTKPVDSSVANHYNGVGNLTFLADSIQYEPLVSAINPVYKYPSFYVVSKFDLKERIMLITYVLIVDSLTSRSKTVRLNVNLMYQLLNNIQIALNEDRIKPDAKVNLLRCSGLISINQVPSDADIWVAYLVWMYSYIGFVGGTRWMDGVCDSPWIPTISFDMSSFDVTPEGDSVQSVDYMFTKRFMQFADIALETLYATLLRSYHRWCSLAEGAGWFAIMYDDETPIQDMFYRHMHIIITALVSVNYDQTYSIVELQKTIAGMNERLAKIEFTLYPSARTYVNNF